MNTFFFNKMVKHHLQTIVNKSLWFSGEEGIMQHFPAQLSPGYFTAKALGPLLPS